MPTPVLTAFAPDLWLGEGERIRFWGIPFGTRMCVIRLPGGVLVHSPVALTDARAEAVAALGPVRWIVAPNLIHSLHVTLWAERFPEAEVLVSPRFPKRHPDIRHDAVLDGPLPDWDDVLDAVVVEGHAFMDEVVFLHRPSRTLIVTDILQRHDASGEGWIWRVLKGWGGVRAPEGGMPRDMRLTFRDRAAARRSIERIMAWEFDRVALAHGLCVEQDGHAWARARFDWLLGPGG